MKKIFFFLGHLPAQMSHGIDLYHKIGGECIVTTKDAKIFCEEKGLKTIMLDDFAEQTILSDCSLLKKTIKFLNEQEGVIFFFDTFKIINNIKSLKKIMLFHGNSLKDQWFEEWKIEYINNCDYITSIGPNWEKVMISKGINEKNIIRIGQTRCDAIINPKENSSSKDIVNGMTNSQGKKIVAYMPTWYGPTSVEIVGKKIIEFISNDYILLFKPHPETPKNIIDEYELLISKKQNIIHVAENRYKGFDLTTLLLISDIFIVGFSSVLIDCLLVNKPIIFASDESSELTINKFEPIKDVFDHCSKLTVKNVNVLNEIIEESSVDTIKWEKSKKNIFFNLNGDSIETLKQFLIKNKLVNE